MMKNTSRQAINSYAASITKAASKQTYYTIRFLVDRERRADAYCAYAYFRWVDDTLDVAEASPTKRITSITRQKSLLEACKRGEEMENITLEEKMLAELVRSDSEKDSGLQTYLHHMMAVMEFDVNRRGRIISQAELERYTHYLASAVTEAMHYFIGHCCYSPRDETRYLAVSAAHITHMLRDTYDDIQAGYFNIPGEVLKSHHITPQDVQSDAFRAWVQYRVQLARTYFKAGKEYLNQVENMRCKLAGFAYTARFEWLLDTIEREGYRLRPQYSERKSVGSGLQMSWSMLTSIIHQRGIKAAPKAAMETPRSLRVL